MLLLLITLEISDANFLIFPDHNIGYIPILEKITNYKLKIFLIHSRRNEKFYFLKMKILKRIFQYLFKKIASQIFQ